MGATARHGAATESGQTMSGPALRMYTVYARPRDLPDAAFAVREFTIMPNGQIMWGPLMGTARDLKEARRLIPPEADNCVARTPRDLPVIVETWF